MKKKTLKIKMTLATVFSGACGEKKRKRWHFKKKLPLTSNEIKKTRRKLKRLISFMTAITALAAILTLCGCGGSRSYIEPEEIAVVSALGFDVSESGVQVSLQTTHGNGDTELKCGEGESVSLALSSVYSMGSDRYELSHCALIVLGDGLTAETVSEILLLCEKSEISDAVLFIGTHEASELLSLNRSSGYDLAFSMRPHPNGAGLFSKNRFYEIMGSEKAIAAEGVIALPYFHVLNGNYSPDGLKLYMSRRESVILDRRESALYLMMKGIFSSGTLEGTRGAISIKSCDTLLSEQGMICRLEILEELTASETAELLSASQTDAARLYDRLRSLHPDPLGIGESKGHLSITFESKGATQW